MFSGLDIIRIEKRLAYRHRTWRLKMTLRKIAQISTLLVSFVLSLLLYSSEYNISNTEEDIESSISEFIGADISINRMEKIDNTMFVYYSDGTNDYIGYTVLYRGLNFKYQIRNANYGTRNRVLYINEFKTLRGKYWSVYGTNYDNLISTISFMGVEKEIRFENVEHEDEILLFHKSKNDSNGLATVFEYSMFDNKSKDITEEMRTYITAQKSSGSAKGKAELFLLNIFCLSIILIGIIVSRRFNLTEKKEVTDSLSRNM